MIMHSISLNSVIDHCEAVIVKLKCILRILHHTGLVFYFFFSFFFRHCIEIMNGNESYNKIHKRLFTHATRLYHAYIRTYVYHWLYALRYYMLHWITISSINVHTGQNLYNVLACVNLKKKCIQLHILLHVTPFIGSCH